MLGHRRGLLGRRVLERYRASTEPDVTADAPGTFRYADQARFERDLAKAGLASTHVEELEVPVMEAATDEELIAWTRAFGLTRLMQGLPEEVQRSWERDFVAAAAPLRKDGFVRLGGVTRLVVASAAAPTTSRVAPPLPPAKA